MILEDPVWFDPKYYRSGFFNTDVTVTGLVANTNFNIKLPTGASSNFRVQASGGGNLFQVNQSSGDWIHSQANQKVRSDTVDGSDTKGVYYCGGGDNTASRGSVLFLGGNECSGSQGVASLASGSASSAYIVLNAATAVSGTIRFQINSVESWRMTDSSLVGYDTALAYNQITRVDNLGRLILCGGTNSSSSNGASLSLGGATYGGTVGLIAGNVSTGHLTYHAPHASARHMFLIASTEQWRMSGNEFTGMNATSNQIARTNDTGYLILSGGSGAGASATGAYVTLRGATATSPGIAIFSSASNSGAYCLFAAEHASGSHRFQIGGTEQFRISGTSIIGYDTSGNKILRVNNTGVLQLSGGSATSTSNGAVIELYGISHATFPGRMYLYSGSASGLMIFQMGLSTGSFAFKDDVGTNLLAISSAQCYLNVATGGDFSFRVNATQIMSLSASGLRLPSLTDAAAGNDTWYYSTTQSKACYKDSGGVSHALY